MRESTFQGHILGPIIISSLSSERIKKENHNLCTIRPIKVGPQQQNEITPMSNTKHSNKALAKRKKKKIEKKENKCCVYLFHPRIAFFPSRTFRI